LKLKHLVVGVLIFGGHASVSHAETLADLLPEFLSTNNQYRAAQADAAAAGESIETAKGGFYPTLDTTGTYGHERQIKPNASDTSMASRELNFSVTQRLWDGGVTDTSIDTARLQHDQTLAVLDSTESGLLLRAFTVYVNVLRAAKALDFAIQSEQNVQEQTELEDAMVERGAGYSTDTMQAKVQLAGAMARRVRAEGALEIAKNAYRGVFLKETGSVEEMRAPNLPLDKLPISQEDAVERALRNNPTLMAGNLDTLIAAETVKQTFASSYRPTVDGILDVIFKEDVSSTPGTQDEYFAKVQVNFPFNLGMTATNTLKASKFAENSAAYRYADAKTQIEERTRNAWQQLKTARLNAELLNNQANIAAEFLELARKERQLGRRSLIDVLSGEVALINANSDAVSAETDIAIAVIALLDAMGDLTEGDLR